MAVHEFDLAVTLNSGQVFHWVPDGDGFSGLIGDEPVALRQSGGSLNVRVGRPELIRNYFALDHPMPAIYRSFPSDPYSRKALACGRGMRVIRQPKWECLATFITSSMKQVAHIRQMTKAIRERYGRDVPGSPVRTYPTPREIATAKESDLRACGLGFRAKNLIATAEAVAEGRVDLDRIAELPSDDLLRELTRLPGVGRKVANCVMLFAYERLEAVPIDVWIGRILQAMRGGGKAATTGQLEQFSRDRLGSYAGYVQQYLFHHARISKSLPGA